MVHRIWRPAWWSANAVRVWLRWRRAVRPINPSPGTLHRMMQDEGRRGLCAAACLGAYYPPRAHSVSGFLPPGLEADHAAQNDTNEGGIPVPKELPTNGNRDPRAGPGQIARTPQLWKVHRVPSPSGNRVNRAAALVLVPGVSQLAPNTDDEGRR